MEMRKLAEGGSRNQIYTTLDQPQNGNKIVFGMKYAREKFEKTSAIVLLLCVMSCQNAGLTGASRNPVEDALRTISKNRKVRPDLSITYDDMHGLWGGTTIIIRGSGISESRERARGDAKPQIFETALPEDKLLELVQLLIELRAWEQDTPERQAVPDESKASLTITVGERTSNMWEWFNDMPKNDRLIKIKTKMGETVKER